MTRPSKDQRAAQIKRAETLRNRVNKLTSGDPQPDAPQSPREFTDEAAREQWLKDQQPKKQK